MVFIKTNRQDLETVGIYFIPFIKEWKQTNLNNIKDSNMHGGEFLLAVAINCIVDENLLLIKKKLINTSSTNQKIKLTDAQAVVLYRLLIILPIPAVEFYFNKLRNEWIEQLDRQLLSNNIYNQNINKRTDLISNSDFYFES